MPLDLVPVSGALGAEIRGVDLRTCDDATLEAVRDALHTYEVVFLRGAHLTAEEHLEVGARFGTPSVYPPARLRGATEPTVTVIKDGPDSPPQADMWHTDITWAAEPPKYALLCAQVVPARGGDTLWASATTAHDALSPTMRRTLAGLEAVHDTDVYVRMALARGGDDPRVAAFAERLREAHPPVRHPLIRTHPDTGRRGLFLGGPSTRRIHGLEDGESEALLGMLMRHVNEPRFHCRWRWTPGDLAIWDERSTLHRSAGDHFPQHREIRRLEIDGDRPYFDPAA